MAKRPGPPKRTDETCQEAVNLLAQHSGNIARAALEWGSARSTYQAILNEAEARSIKPTIEAPVEEEHERVTSRRHPMPSPQWVDGISVEIVSRPDNTFLFGACGDQHVGSKYHREDVSRDLFDRYKRAGVQCVFNTGNWIDGEAPFNRYDITTAGLDQQCKLLSSCWPVSEFPTYAVWGDDHEGWYAQREGIDVGKYAEGIMRSAGHDWHDLGFMEAHVRLTNCNTGVSSILSVVHPGGGTAYALSYRPQKIIESYEGGNKPHIVLFGHYHKLDPGLVRNVWYLQTGCVQDQTPFMRKKSIEAHVGGATVHLEQDPDTGAITSFTPSLHRYFNRSFYANNQWSKHGAVTQVPRSIGGI